MNKPICLYHGSDLDGQCSGAIYAKANSHREHVLHPIDYGDPVPWDLCEDAEVTLIDFSIQPWADFERLMRVAKSVVWIDHHLSAIKEWENRGYPDGLTVTAVLNEKFAGCELAWKVFFAGEPMPEGVRLLGRYDVWDHADLKTLPFQYGMRLLDLDPLSGSDRNRWRTIFCGNALSFVHDICGDGDLLLKYQRQNDAAAVSKAWFPLEFAGFTWQACNRLDKGSGFYESVWDPTKYAGMLSFGFDGKQWGVGLYSDSAGIDCGAIAKHHGGGGHPGAAGFRRKTLPFDLLQETQT